MKKTNKQNNANNNQVKKNKAIANPKDTLWGKILIWTLILMMGLIPFIGLMFMLFE